jgi:hypothetical protein
VQPQNGGPCVLSSGLSSPNNRAAENGTRPLACHQAHGSRQNKWWSLGAGSQGLCKHAQAVANAKAMQLKTGSGLALSVPHQRAEAPASACKLRQLVVMFCDSSQDSCQGVVIQSQKLLVDTPCTGPRPHDRAALCRLHIMAGARLHG